ncbi:hypothetical protein [Microbacter margulisiae]|uniref:Glycosyl transferase family 2 n=1 Tax=Microbacter margulisiae TaxID=1350067 RepID=A0A7W5DUF2_9PORP|nr:hypothetical protein [Microbacter margulisiae]MBB3188413.1 hypothetical protein [Microbacter margulisiae]
MEDYRIKIYTRSMNPALYDRAMFFMDLPYPKIRLTHTTADGYFYKILEDTEADIVVNIDEDAFVFNTKRLQSLIQYVIDNDYVNCGMPDGGVVGIRAYSPVVTNPYFNILNTKKIRERFSLNEIKNIAAHPPFDASSHPKYLLKTNYRIEIAEPFYPFFLWINQYFKTFYLDAEDHSDHYSTCLKNHNGEPFLLHTWFSRNYYFNRFHTRRINAVVAYCETKTGKKFKEDIEKKIRNLIWIIFTFSNTQRRKIRRWYYASKK